MVLDSLPQADYLIWENDVAESKKKRSSSVQTRVVTAGNGDDSAKQKTKTSKKAANTTLERASDVTKASVNNARAEKKAKVGYFKGAWYELKQVRWPDRKSTWEMTFAVILFTAFFVVFVLLLDAAFKYLFDLIIS